MIKLFLLLDIINFRFIFLLFSWVITFSDSFVLLLCCMSSILQFLPYKMQRYHLHLQVKGEIKVNRYIATTKRKGIEERMKQNLIFNIFSFAKEEGVWGQHGSLSHELTQRACKRLSEDSFIVCRNPAQRRLQRHFPTLDLGLCLVLCLPFHLSSLYSLHKTGLNVDTSAGFEKPPHSFLGGSHAHTASVPRSAITEAAFLYAPPPVIVLTTMGAIDGFESMDFCG